MKAQLFQVSHRTTYSYRSAVPVAAETPPWESVRSLCRSDHSGAVLEATEFTFASPLIPVDEKFSDYASRAFPPARPILEAVLGLTGLIYGEFTFDATATTVST